MSGSPWPLIHAEREALITDLKALTDERWATPSLCPGWTVHDVLAHMIATAKMTQARFFIRLAGSGFRFHEMNGKNVTRELVGTPADQLASFSTLITATAHPPGPLEAMLGEAVIHSEDIRRPLGISRSYPTEAVVRVADFFKASNLLIGSKQRIAGLTLSATDTDWSTGSGPSVNGPVLSLALAMTGRRAALDDLSGEGLETLRGRA